MRRRRPGPEPLPRPPSWDDFSPAAVRRAVLSQTFQHPATIFPLVGVAVASLVGLLNGFVPLTVGLDFLAGFVGLGSWVVNYYFRGHKFAADHVERLREARAQSEAAEIEGIEADCRSVGFAEGATQARSLTDAYRGLCDFLQEKTQDGQNLGAEQFRVLAEDAYREGVGLLRKALGVHRAISQVDPDSMEQEVTLWNRQLARLEQKEETEGEQRVLAAKIEGHQSVLEAYHKRADMLQQLLTDAVKLTAELEKAKLELVDLVGANASTMFGGEAASRLKVAVTAARNVEERLRGSEAQTPEDQMYLAAGKRLKS